MAIKNEEDFDVQIEEENHRDHVEPDDELEVNTIKRMA